MIVNTKIILLLISFTILFHSCRKEEDILITGTDESALKANSKVTDLIKKVVLKDGSSDNILDTANCFSLKLPVTVIVNGITVVVNSEQDYSVVENMINDDVRIIFPTVVILSNYSEITVHNQNELDALKTDCNGEDEEDEDIECVDFNYPISGSIYDAVTEQRNSFSIQNDKQLYLFIIDLDPNEVVHIDFPVGLTFYDGTTLEVNDLKSLENAINSSKDECDEDDNFNFDISSEYIENLLTSCDFWTIHKLEVNGNTFPFNFSKKFTFSNDGTLTTSGWFITYSGNWNCSGTGENINLAITNLNIPSTPFNGNWTFYEIHGIGSDKKIEFRTSSGNILQFKTTCN